VARASRDPPQVERERQGAEAVAPQVLQVLLDEHAAPVVLEPATAVVAPPSAPAGAGAESSPMIDAAFRGGQTPPRRRAGARPVTWNAARRGTGSRRGTARRALIGTHPRPMLANMPRKPTARPAGKPRRSMPRRSPRRAWGAGALAALIVAVLAALGIARHHRDEARRMTRSRDAQAARDTALQELDLPAANRLAIERAQSRRFLESLPYFRRELQLLDHDVWGLHYDFATV